MQFQHKGSGFEPVKILIAIDEPQAIDGPYIERIVLVSLLKCVFGGTFFREAQEVDAQT